MFVKKYTSISLQIFCFGLRTAGEIVCPESSSEFIKLNCLPFLVHKRPGLETHAI